MLPDKGNLGLTWGSTQLVCWDAGEIDHDLDKLHALGASYP